MRRGEWDCCGGASRAKRNGKLNVKKIKRRKTREIMRKKLWILPAKR
jgi:hypothetical protein